MSKIHLKNRRYIFSITAAILSAVLLLSACSAIGVRNKIDPTAVDTIMQNSAYGADDTIEEIVDTESVDGPGPMQNYDTDSIGPGDVGDRPMNQASDEVEIGIGPGKAMEEIIDPDAVNMPIPNAGDNVSGHPGTFADTDADEGGLLGDFIDANFFSLGPDKPDEHFIWNSCMIEGDSVVLRGTLDGGITPPNTQMGEDGFIYLLEQEPYEDLVAPEQVVASELKATDVSFSLPLNLGTAGSRLYRKYVLCIWSGKEYIPVSETVSIMNPEAAATHNDPYREPLSKKGLLIELSQVSDAFSLGVCNVIINIPFNTLVGEGIDYQYDGELYHFSKDVVEVYDRTIATFSNKSMNVTAVLLNRFNPDMSDFFLPKTSKVAGVNYYHFNTATEAGCKQIQAVASFLADRYSGNYPDCGRIQNWVIGNEINNQEWNYIGPMDLDMYLTEYERSFRVFYNAIKSTCANDRVFFSLDNNWNQLANGQTRYGAKETLALLAEKIRLHGNLDWGLAYHPYSVPMTEPEFWNDFETGQVSWSEKSGVVNFANLAVLTDYMQKEEMLDSGRNVRHIILSEQGFTSKSPKRGNVEKLQAASFAYAYYIADSNPYIDSFIMSRQIDAPSELKNSLAFGLWTTNSREDVNISPDKKKYIWKVFRDIDQKKKTLESTEFAKELIGIDRWSDVIPNFKWKRLEK